MLKESKVAVISTMLEDFCKRIHARSPLSQQSWTGWSVSSYLYSKPRSPLSQQSWRICVKGIQGRRYLSNVGGFVLKESKIAVISAMLEDLC